MVLDLNRILNNADKTGKVRAERQRSVLSIVDAVVVGEGNGPLSPSPRPLGRIVGGFNQLTIDAVCAQLIGFDWRRVPLLREGARVMASSADLDSTRVRLESGPEARLPDLVSLPTEPPSGWKGHVELRTHV
jgi:uncharacterized protein (DUF362 family)